jgi:hypothetical protein
MRRTNSLPPRGTRCFVNSEISGETPQRSSPVEDARRKRICLFSGAILAPSYPCVQSDVMSTQIDAKLPAVIKSTALQMGDCRVGSPTLPSPTRLPMNRCRCELPSHHYESSVPKALRTGTNSSAEIFLPHKLVDDGPQFCNFRQ